MPLCLVSKLNSVLLFGTSAPSSQLSTNLWTMTGFLHTLGYKILKPKQIFDSFIGYSTNECLHYIVLEHKETMILIKLAYDRHLFFVNKEWFVQIILQLFPDIYSLWIYHFNYCRNIICIYRNETWNAYY